MNLSQISTFDLVNELVNRQGVESTVAYPNKEVQVQTSGPAVVLVITD